MTIISNLFALACRHLPQKYTISTLQSIDIADNQNSCGYIWKFSRFTIELMRKLCYPINLMRLTLQPQSLLF